MGRAAAVKNFVARVALLVGLLGVSLPAHPSRVLCGADVLLGDSIHLVRGKRVGLVANQTSLLSTGTRLLDTLRSAGIRVTALFSPEHGIRGSEAAGVRVGQETDSATGLPVYSLYGRVTRPTTEMLRNVDLLVYDLQDAGARFFTYVSTLYYCMDAAAERNIPIVVLDRPDPIGGSLLEGPVLEKNLHSFNGIIPIPIRYGMTPGELARMIVGEGWLPGGRGCDLRVVPLRNWNRAGWFDATGLRWISPSPNMKTPATAGVYPGVCLFEGTNLSEGRGTEHPFEWIGAPFLDGPALAAELERRSLAGVRFEPVDFTPESIPRVAPEPRYRGERCSGVAILVADRERFRPVAAALHILDAAMRQAPGRIAFSAQFDILSGQHDLRKKLSDGIPVDRIAAAWKEQLDIFAAARKRYLLYPLYP